ncbi:MAG TPA: threonine synthase [Ktedonobacteraceae bacterium]
MGENPLDLQPDRSNSSVLKQLATIIVLRCVECASLYPGVSEQPRYRCDCGGVLDVDAKKHHLLQQEPALQAGFETLTTSEPDVKPFAGAHLRQLFEERVLQSPTWPVNVVTQLPDSSGVWRYRELILPIPEQYIVSRPEGNTGLYPVGRENCGNHRAGHSQIGHYAGLDYLFLKHEGENPTGSFKDRGMTVGVTMANLLGARAVACASTGNTSASLASYAAQLGLPGIVFLPSTNVAAGKLAQSLAYGATTVQIEGDFDDAMRLVEQVCNELGIYLLNSLNPFRIEGQKAIGFELLQQLEWEAPDWLVLPAGNLGNTSAIGKAFRQAHRLGLISRVPRIAAIQASGANPFFRSFMSGFSHREHVQAQTIATAIKIGDPVSYSRARQVIEESNGVVEEVTDEEILAAKTVIDRSGIGCEPASAATLAGARRLVERGIIKHEERVVGILTGNLLKDSQTGIPQHKQDDAVPASIRAVKRALTNKISL